MIQLYCCIFCFSPSETEKEEKPSLYISMIHKDFLKKICDEKSDLKGLVYHGGPKVDCECDEWSGILPFVGYPDNIPANKKCTCVMCRKLYNADELLRKQVSHRNT